MKDKKQYVSESDQGESSDLVSSGDESKTQLNNEPSSVLNKSGDLSNKKNSSKDKTTPSVRSTFSVEELSPDDEVFTFQCPENYRKHMLGLKNVDFNELNSIISQKTGEEFQLEVINLDKSFITMAFPTKNSKGCFVNLPLRGHILVQRNVNVSSPDFEPIDSDSHKVSFPTDIKVRHPLLGTEWKEHIDLANEAIKKSHVMRKLLKKMKKEKMEVEESSKAKRKSRELKSSPEKKRRKT